MIKIQNLTIMETIIKHHPVIKRIMVTIHKQEKDNSNHKDYVAPYQSKDATQVARGLSPFR